MFWVQSVESKNNRIQLSKGTMVGLLVCVAIWANISSFQRVAEIRREIAFREQLTRSLDQLTTAADAVAQKKLSRSAPVR